MRLPNAMYFCLSMLAVLSASEVSLGSEVDVHLAHIKAVARKMHEAKALADKVAAAAEYRRAFDGARDRDQVDAIAKELTALGIKVDVTAHLGIIRHWQVLGPFDNTGGIGFDKAYPPEQK